MNNDNQFSHYLNLRGVKCPVNYIKTRLFLDKLSSGEILNVILDLGEPVESVINSSTKDGNKTIARNDYISFAFIQLEKGST